MHELYEIKDRRFAHCLLHNATLEPLASGFRWLEGPVWIGDADCLLVQDVPRDRTLRWSEQAGVTVFRTPSNYANGQTRDRQGRLISCSHGGRCLYRTEYDGSVTTLVTHHDGKRLNSPNDVAVKSDGTIWFTDPTYGISNDYEGRKQSSEQAPAVYRYDPARNELRVMADDFDGPNGIAFSADERRLYVSETGDPTQEYPRQYIRVFDVTEDGSKLGGGQIFYKVDPGYCDGLTVDSEDNVWSSAGDGVHCIDRNGEFLGKVRVPTTVANVAFGGCRNNRLFIAASHTLYALYLNCRGAQWP
jgi:gluconolactonase